MGEASLTDLTVRWAVALLAVASVVIPLRAGRLSLATGGFMAIGGLVAIAVTAGPAGGVPLAIVCAGILGGAGGAVLALAAHRVGGIAFAMVTLAVTEAMRALLLASGLAGGGAGLRLPQADVVPWALGSALAFLVVLVALWRSPLAGAWDLLAERPRLAVSMGLPVRWLEVISLAVAGSAGAAAGALLTRYRGFADADAFGALATIDVTLAAIASGVDLLLGPLLGSVLVVLLPEAGRVAGVWRGVVLGGVVLAVLLARLMLERYGRRTRGSLSG